jgi:hypothetical protein
MNIHKCLKYIAFALLLLLLLKYMPGLNIPDYTIFKIVVVFTVFIFVIDMFVYSSEYMESIPGHYIPDHSIMPMEHPAMMHPEMEHPDMMHPEMEHPEMEHPEIKHPEMDHPEMDYEPNEYSMAHNKCSHKRPFTFRRNHPLSSLVHSCCNPYIHLKKMPYEGHHYPKHHMMNKFMWGDSENCQSDYMVPKEYDATKKDEDYMKTGLNYDLDLPYQHDFNKIHGQHGHKIPFSLAPKEICKSKMDSIIRANDLNYRVWSPHIFSGKDRGYLNWETTYP